MVLERRFSDHCPLVLKEARDMNFGPKPFRVLGVWLNDAGIDEVVGEAWRTPVTSCRPDCVVRDRLKNVKMALKMWSREGSGERDIDLEKCRQEVLKWEKVADKREVSNSEIDTWMEARRLWLEKEKRKTVVLRQRARVKWAAEGDENSKLFHTMVRRSCRKGEIRGLHVEGVWCEDPYIIKESVREYFGRMFSEEDQCKPRFISSSFKRLPIEERQEIETPFSEEEIWGAVRRCGSSKALGPDGFNFRFIKRHWSLMKGEILRALEWFWENGCISRGCNNSFVSLIPKVSNPVGLGDFRPISLIGFFYKIVAKVLVERMKKVIGSVIGEVQSAFVEGRSILDGVLVANEGVDYVRNRRKKALVFKVDFEKAYDCIN